MTIQLTKDTEGGAPATYWTIKERNDNGISTEIVVQGYYDLYKLAIGKAVDTFRIPVLVGIEDPLKNPASIPSFLEYLESNPTKNLFDACVYLLEKHIIDNVPGWESATIL